MSGLKYHGGMKGLYAMLALTEASLVDDDVDTTPVRTKKRQDHEDEGQVTIHMRTRWGRKRLAPVSTKQAHSQ